MNINDTVAAISTPYGRGGIAVIRISGIDAVEIADRFFVPCSGKKLSEYKGACAVHGRILYNGAQIDDGLATIFYSPKSYTGENTVEISCHGGIALTNTVLESAFLSGARQAEAGEFTKRAFLNGKISLTQAEAVIDLIDASSLENIKIASSQSSGLLSGGISESADKMTDLLSEIYVTADYPDEDLENLTSEEFLHSLKSIREKLDELGKTYKAGNAICEGIRTAIVGRPNVGKSTILNSLLRSERAIVSDIPGTTRDTIEETVTVGKIMLRISDTAGIHSTEDIIEKKGIERTVKKAESSTLIIAVFDGSEPLNDEDDKIISWLSGLNATVLPVVTKRDISTFSVPELPHEFERPVIFSNKEPECINTLCRKISSLFVDEKIDYSSMPVLTNLRQFTLVKNASDIIRSAVNALENGISADMVALDVERAHSLISEVDGRGTAEEITDKIFHRFCVGK